MLPKPLKRVWSLLPERTKGTLDYWFRPSVASGFGILNGQLVRQHIFGRILAELNVGQIVETGTFRGTTTAFFAQTGLPVHSIEASKRYYEYSKIRLRSSNNVHLYQGSSVDLLPEICVRLQAAKFPTFVYLDAHWGDFLPLRKEIELLSQLLPKSIIMIDDFEVPGDEGYRFDDYGPGKRISLDYLDAANTSSPIYKYFPNTPSSEDTGQRRGMCVATLMSEIRDQLDAIELLKFHSAKCPSRGL
jgi:hypothetical protein